MSISELTTISRSINEQTTARRYTNHISLDDDPNMSTTTDNSSATQVAEVILTGIKTTTVLYTNDVSTASITANDVTTNQISTTNYTCDQNNIDNDTLIDLIHKDLAPYVNIDHTAMTVTVNHTAIAGVDNATLEAARIEFYHDLALKICTNYTIIQHGTTEKI